MMMLPNTQIPADVETALKEALAHEIGGLNTIPAIQRRALRFFLAHLNKVGEIRTDVGRPQLLPLPYEAEVAKAAQVKVRSYRRKSAPEADPVEEAV